MKKQGTTFYCFSPPVMIATFAIEIILLLYLVVRYKMSPIARIIAALLGFLALFQYSEFHVCETIGTTEFYSRLGYVAITMLPPLGIHLVSKLAKKDSKKLLVGAYGSAAAFISIFAFAPNTFDSMACAGNYAVFHLAGNTGGFYFAWYYLLMFLGIWMCIKYSAKVRSKKMRDALRYQAFGYISFILPTGIVNALNPQTLEGIPSIMCGFAVIYALILAFAIAPRALKEKPVIALPKLR